MVMRVPLCGAEQAPPRRPQEQAAALAAENEDLRAQARELRAAADKVPLSSAFLAYHVEGATRAVCESKMRVYCAAEGSRGQGDGRAPEDPGAAAARPRRAGAGVHYHKRGCTTYCLVPILWCAPCGPDACIPQERV